MEQNLETYRALLDAGHDDRAERLLQRVSRGPQQADIARAAREAMHYRISQVLFLVVAVLLVWYFAK
jgi:hypothetical protein